MKNKNYITLCISIVALITIGWLTGFLTNTQIDTWYNTLQQSPLTPPNYMFSIAWTILYTVIAISGWIIWHSSNSQLKTIKLLYGIQLLLNLSWSPLFFSYHLIGASLMVLLLMDSIVIAIIYLSYSRIKSVALLMTPYLLWILFATYLNFYIWKYNI